MRYYRQDGSYFEDKEDDEFGWYFHDIVVDEASPRFKEKNEQIKRIARLKKTQSLLSSNCFPRNDSHENNSSDDNEIEESIDALKELESTQHFSETFEGSMDVTELNPLPKRIQKIEPNVKIETPSESTSYQYNVEGPELNVLKQFSKLNVPSKGDLIALINPINTESRALLSVISYSRFQRLDDKETNDDVFKSINFKTTNSKRLLIERSCNNSPFHNDPSDFMPVFNFVLNDNNSDIDEENQDRQLYTEIENYNATKEDNMLSLMMELIITDMDSNAGDLAELNNSVNELNNGFGGTETSDLENSIHSSIVSKEGNNGFRILKGEKSHYLDIPNRSDILSSIGLSDDIDKSILSFSREKAEMHQQLCEIKESFQEDEKKLDSLMEEAIALQNDLRETTFLDNLIHLLNGRIERVNSKKLPFRIFQRAIDNREANPDLII